MTSSPGPIPAAKTAAWSAAVPEFTATAWRASTAPATARSNASTAGPVVSQSDRRAAATACTSSSSMLWRGWGKGVDRTGVPPWRASGSGIGQRLHLCAREPDLVRVGGVAEAHGRALAALAARERPGWVERLEDEHVVVLHGLAALVLGEQNLVELLARPDADELDAAAPRHGPGQLHHPHARELGHKDLAALRKAGAADSKLDALLEPDPESRHAGISHRHRARGSLRAEERDHAAPATDDVAVAYDRRHGAARMTVRIGLDDQFLGTELRRAVEINRIHGLVGADGDDPLDVSVDGGVDHILGPVDIGLDRLEGIVFARGNLLEGSRVHHDIDAVHGPGEPVAIPHVADEEAEGVVIEARHHLRLLELVAAEDDEALRMVLRQHDLHELVAEGARAARHEHGRLGPVQGPRPHRRHARLAPLISRPGSARSGGRG